MDKNNILLLVIIFLIILTVFYGKFIFSKEGFQANDTENKNELSAPSKCEYIPWGTSIDKCVENCKSNIGVGLWDKTGNLCNDNVCKEICGLCSHERCQWVASFSTQERKRLLNTQNNDTNLSKLLPKKLDISGISFPDTEFSTTFDDRANIKLNWTNHGDASSFMIHFYNMNRSDNMIKVEYLNDSETSEYTISNIDTNTKYLVILYSINEYGISSPSNTLLVET